MKNPANVFHFCPRCGSARFVAKGEKSFQCADCAFHFFINSAAAVVALIFNEQGEVLLTIRGVDPNKGSLDLPGGFVDPGERAEEALRREIFEELNLEITGARYLTSFPNEYPFSGLLVYTTDLTFLCQVKDLQSIRCADDVEGYRFVRLEDIDYSRIFSVSIGNILKYYHALQVEHSKSGFPL